MFLNYSNVTGGVNIETGDNVVTHVAADMKKLYVPICLENTVGNIGLRQLQYHTTDILLQNCFILRQCLKKTYRCLIILRVNFTGESCPISGTASINCRNVQSHSKRCTT